MIFCLLGVPGILSLSSKFSYQCTSNCECQELWNFDQYCLWCQRGCAWFIQSVCPAYKQKEYWSWSFKTLQHTRLYVFGSMVAGMNAFQTQIIMQSILCWNHCSLGYITESLDPIDDSGFEDNEESGKFCLSKHIFNLLDINIFTKSRFLPMTIILQRFVPRNLGVI